MVEYRLSNEGEVCSCYVGALHEMRVDNVRNNTIYNFISSNLKKLKYRIKMRDLLNRFPFLFYESKLFIILANSSPTYSLRVP